MTNFEIDEKARDLSDGESAYALARQLVKMEMERDALAAYVKRLTQLGSNLSSALAGKAEPAAAQDNWQAVLAEAPAIGLAHRDAEVAANAIENLARQLGDADDRAAAMAAVTEYRRKAEGL